jgi:hypothetical protein
MIAPIRREPPTGVRRDLRKARRWIAEGFFSKSRPASTPKKVPSWIAGLSAGWIVLVACAYLWSSIGRPLLERWF